jgi:hypothetical protein
MAFAKAQRLFVFKIYLEDEFFAVRNRIVKQSYISLSSIYDP